MTRVAIIADDLSGAVESAATFLLRTTRITVTLSVVPQRGAGAAAGPECDVHVVDTDSRELSGPAAADRTLAAVAAIGEVPVVVKKIDSLLRGNVAAELQALRGSRPHLIVAPALPATGRTVRDGRVWVGEQLLHETDTWRAEAADRPLTVAHALHPLPAVTVPLAIVRSDALAARLCDILLTGSVPVCDALTDDDLDRIVAAADDLDRPVLVGSAGIAAAVARRLAPAAGPVAGPPTPRSGSVLVVVGSAAPGIETQLAALSGPDVHTVVLHPDELSAAFDAAAFDTADSSAAGSSTAEFVTAAGVLTDIVERIENATAPVVVVTVEAAAGVDPLRSRRIVNALAAVASAAASRAAGLVLTGGETARAVLDRLGVTGLRPLGQVHHGAVVSVDDAGRLVATRPGSFGGPSSLLEMVSAVRDALGIVASHSVSSPPASSDPSQPVSPHPTEESRMSKNPFIAVTMGDGAGVGPEVVVKALLAPEVADNARCVVIGDTGRLQLAADRCGLTATVNLVEIDEIGQAEFAPGRINVIDPHLIPADLPFGVLSPIAGDAAYQYIRIACELAMAGKVQAICTAPLNKEALHAGGHLYPGHTELLAALTGTGEVSMMLSTPKVKVIHVTTHIGLIDAIAKIEPGLVERTVRRGYQAMVDSGISNPKIAVCAINPHAGENGLFGRGEEAEKITPALEILRADGIDARGPVPADTAFFLAGRGDYDLVVAMYHDQGHGPVKVLGLEAGVNITVGLPVIRTSVDHGTAFDIAGKGIADPGSMLEALRQAIEMAPEPAVA